MSSTFLKYQKDSFFLIFILQKLQKELFSLTKSFVEVFFFASLGWFVKKNFKISKLYFHEPPYSILT